MAGIALRAASVVGMLLPLLCHAPANAANFVSFVSSTGTSTICTRTAPCGDFQSAVNVTLSEGEVHCLDSGPFGPLGNVTTITTPITIDCADAAGAVYTGTFVINAAGDYVKIRNLALTGISGVGIDFQDGASLIVDKCIIQNVSHNPPFVGIKFRPASPGARLVVTDTVLNNNGNVNGFGTSNFAIGAAIVISPQAGGTAQVALKRVTAVRNIFGIVADGTGSSGGINMTIADSLSGNNAQDGIIAVTPSGGAPIAVMVTNSQSVNNAIGVRAIGPNVTVRVKNSDVTGNGSGLAVANGGVLLTYGNNAVQANGTDGSFSGPVPLQ